MTQIQNVSEFRLFSNKRSLVNILIYQTLTCVFLSVTNLRISKLMIYVKLKLKFYVSKVIILC